MFLTPDELAEYSRRTRPTSQLAWALERGFIADERMTDADGRPLVLRSLFFGAQTEAPKAEPNWGAARG